MVRPRKSRPERAQTSMGVVGRVMAPVLVGLIALIPFLLTLAPTVTAEDSGELIAAAWHFGVPHPPGYPLWTILCGVFTRLFAVGSVAVRAGLFSAVCSATAAAFTFAGLRECGLRRASSAVASLVWIWARWSWSQSVIVEVYALNSMLTAALLWCALRWEAGGSHRPLLTASVVLGLGMSNHHTLALAGMALVLWILLRQPRLVLRWRLVAGCVGLFLSGLLPYAYLPVRAAANPVINWGDPSTAERFWDHVTRQQYGAIGPMKTQESRTAARFGRQLGYLADSMIDDLTVGSASIGVVALLWTGLRRRRILLFAVLWILCTGVLFALLANYDSDRTSRWAMRVFLIPASLGLAVPLAFLLDAVQARLERAAFPGRRGAALVVAAVGGAAPAAQLAVHWSHCDYSNYWYAHDHARNMLACMQNNALVFPSGDHNCFPLVYLVMVEGQRSDVVIADIYGYVSPRLYEDRPDDSPHSPEAWVILKSKRPVYYTTKKASPVSAARFVLAGTLYHLLPDGYAFDDSELRARCVYRNLEEPGVVDFGASHILCSEHFFAGLYELRAGRVEAAMARFEKSAAYGTGIREVFNNMGSALAEHGHEERAIPFLKEAARLDGRYMMPRWNLYRIHRQLGRFDDAGRELERIMKRDPGDVRAWVEMAILLRDNLGDLPGAIHYFEQALERRPGDRAIADALARCRSALALEGA